MRLTRISMPRVVFFVVKKILFYPNNTLIFTHSLYFSTVQLVVTRWDEQEEKLFVEKKANGFFENSESLTRGKCCVLLPAKTYFSKCWGFFSHKQTSVSKHIDVVVSIFTAPENIFSSYFCFALYFRVNDVLSVTRWDEQDDHSYFLGEESECFCFLKTPNSRGKDHYDRVQLDMNKKTFVNSHSTLFCFVLVEISSRTRSIERLLLRWTHNIPTCKKKNQPLSNTYSPSPLT